MSKNEEKLQVLSRLGRETIIKNGTYDIEKAREIDPDNPEKGRSTIRSTLMKYEDEPSKIAAPIPEKLSDEDASDLAAQIIASNFRTGMSQAEVDAFMNSMK